MHDGGLERNSAAYVFEVAITLTEAGLAAAPGALSCCRAALQGSATAFCTLLYLTCSCLALNVRQPHQGLGACRRVSR